MLANINLFWDKAVVTYVQSENIRAKVFPAAQIVARVLIRTKREKVFVLTVVSANSLHKKVQQVNCVSFALLESTLQFLLLKTVSIVHLGHTRIGWVLVYVLLVHRARFLQTQMTIVRVVFLENM